MQLNGRRMLKKIFMRENNKWFKKIFDNENIKKPGEFHPALLLLIFFIL